MSTQQLLIVALPTCITILALQYFRRARLPPGPPGLPIVGNLFNMPVKNQWLVYADWAKKYGEILSITAVGQVIIVLDSAQDVRELLVKRGTQFADRVRLTMPILSGWENTITLLTPEKFRIVKKFTAKCLGQQVIPRIVNVVDKEVTGYLERQFRESGTIDPSGEIRRLVGGTVLRYTYGYEIQSDNDPYVSLSEEALSTVLEASDPGWAVNVIPWLRYLPGWLPGMGFKRTAKRWHQISDESHSAILEWTRKQFLGGSAEPSLAADLLAQPCSDGHDDLYFITLGDLYVAGTDTMSSACLNIMLQLALYPDVQERAQREVDSITSGERIPLYSDRGSLPYVNALIKEAYRMGTIAPLALPRRVPQTMEYKGYLLPENAILFPNVWSILHNPSIYPDPFTFSPERFLGAEASPPDDDGVNEDPMKYVFGFGARQCPGRFLADATVFLFTAKILATCTLSDAVDETGAPIEPREVKYASTFVSRPEPFKCTIQPKANAKDLLLG